MPIFAGGGGYSVYLFYFLLHGECKTS